jgi:putative peptidoglycan lipid II flippase
VLFPRMSREAGTKDLTALRRTVGLGLRHNIALLVPSSVILALLGPEIIGVAFQRGNFLDWNTLLAARVLAGYCVGMLGVVLFTFLQRFHYAWGDYRTPTWSAVVVLAVNVGLSLVLKETTLRVAGLSVANSAGFTIGTIILAVSSRRILGGLELRTIRRVALRTLLATSPAIVALTLLRLFWGAWWSMGSTFGNLLRLLGSGTLVVGVTVAMYVLLRMEVVDLVGRRRR